MTTKRSAALALTTFIALNAQGMGRLEWPADSVPSSQLLRARFDGKVYRTPLTHTHSYSEIWEYITSGGGKPWPSRVEIKPGPKPPTRVTGGKLRVTWVNYSTMLVQMDGVNILTDPVWSSITGPLGLGPRRVHEPGLRLEDLPKLDAVVVSHNHFDHLDLPTLKLLAKAHNCPIIVPSRNGRLLQAEGLGRIRELDWWEDMELPGGFRITAVPARHWSQRGLRDVNQALWCSFVLEGPSGKVFFAGDTGFGTHFTQIREVCGPMRAALLPIGTYEPRAFMKHAHMNPEEAMQAAIMLGAKTIVPMHSGPFPKGTKATRRP